MHHSIIQYNGTLGEKEEVAKLPLILGDITLYLNNSKEVNKQVTAYGCIHSGVLFGHKKKVKVLNS